MEIATAPPPTRLLPARTPHPLPVILAVLMLASVALLAWLALKPPRLPAPGVEVAARGWHVRMAAHLRALGEPRLIATHANARARIYLLDQLRAMGYAPEVQRATVRRSVVYFFGGRHTTIGVVHNVVVRISGSAADAAKRPALLLTAQYDSGSSAADAASTAAPAVALLETARVLRAAPHANDVVLLFADGEAVGMLGARGFVEQHPLARRIGLALKFDSGGGPLRLFGTSGASAAALAGWQHATPEVPGSSLLAEMARMLPNAPLVGPLAQLDAPVLLFTGTGSDTGGGDGLVHLGDAMLRLARVYADAPLARGRDAGRSYFMLPLAGPVQHAHAVNWVLLLGSCLALAGAWRRIHRDDQASEALQGLFGVAFLLVIVRIGTWNWRAEMATAGVTGDARMPMLLVAAATCAFIGALALLRRSVGATSTVLGALAWAALALAAVAAVLPGAAYLLAWPLVLGLGAVLALQSPWGLRRHPLARLALLLAGLAPSLVLFPPALRDAWLLLAPQRMYMVPMLMALPLLCFAALPLMLRGGALVAGALALAAAVFCLSLPPALAEPPKPSEPGLERLVYYKDMNSWRAYWLLPPQELDAWTRGLFPSLTKPTVFVELFGLNGPHQWYGVAPRDDAIAYPECFILRNSVGKVRLGRFTVRSRNRAPNIEMWVSFAKPLRSRLDGAPLTDSEGPWRLSLYGMEDRVMQFEIETKPEEIFAVTVQENMPGLPRHLLPARPDGIPPLGPQVGATVSTDILRFF